MKEYRFRGWETVCGKGWVYGDLVHNMKITIDDYVPRVMVGGYEVDKASVGLFSGLQDSCGKPVYEGDVVCIRFSSGEVTAAVELTDGAFSVTNGGVTVPVSVFLSLKGISVEVIGNVFEQSKEDWNEREGNEGE